MQEKPTGRLITEIDLVRQSEHVILLILSSLIIIFGVPASPLHRAHGSGITTTSTGATTASTATSLCSLRGLSDRKPKPSVASCGSRGPAFIEVCMKFENMPDNKKSPEVYHKVENCGKIFSRLSRIIPENLKRVTQTVHGDLSDCLVYISNSKAGKGGGRYGL